jgi:hypothetical protein
MKKHIVMTLMALATLTAGAQGVWKTGMTKGDELKGKVPEPYYQYDVSGVGSFISWDWDKANFRITTDQGQFKAWEKTMVYANGNQVKTGDVYTTVTAGLYDKDGKLEKKVEFNMYVEDDSGNAWIHTYEWYGTGRGKIRKVIEKIKSGEGYVRFVVGRRGMADFDLIVTPYTKQ